MRWRSGGMVAVVLVLALACRGDAKPVAVVHDSIVVTAPGVPDDAAAGGSPDASR